MKLDKRNIAKLNIEPPTLPPVPPGPWIERAPDGATVTASGLDAIRAWAMRGKTQEGIAAELHISRRAFESMLGKADADPPSEVRLAWEAGHAAHKSALIEKLTEKALAGDTISGFFLLKAVHQLRDQGAAVNIEAGPKITFALPAPFATEEEYMRSIGQDAVVDSRAPDKRGLSPFAALGLEPPVPQLPKAEGENTNAKA
jgi:predicted DNA-binding protein (UPF0251 family)